MAVTREQVLAALAEVPLPEGGDLVARDAIRALRVEDGVISFVIEAATPEEARSFG
ncbi:MAG: iron-sulfur cluster assembly protein, partial [Gemmobacter sp.]|nr:iron-sulfur cluster assembly protein [Gemmobacter sp.]